MFEPPTVVGKNPFLHDSLMQKCLLFYIKAQYWQNNGTAVFITHYAIGKVRFMEKYWVLVMFEPPTPPCQWSQDFCTAVGHQSLPISQNRLTCRVAGTKWTKWKSLIYAKQTNWFQASDPIFRIQRKRSLQPKSQDQKQLWCVRFGDKPNEWLKFADVCKAMSLYQSRQQTLLSVAW